MFKRISILAALAAILALASPVAASAVPPSWSAPVTVDTSGTITSVSCSEPKFCAAVDSAGNALIYNGSVWKTYAGIVNITYGLTSVSCRSTSFCMAVGYKGNAVVYHDGTWSAPVEIDEGRNFASVSCASESFCVALDKNGYVVTYTGNSWGAPVDVGDTYGEPESVSCASESFCDAIYASGYVTTYKGVTWTVPANIIGDNGFVSVSCASESFCAAVDSVAGNALMYENGSWTSVHIASADNLESVSCTSKTFCMAVGYDYNNEAYALIYKGNSWGAPVQIEQDYLLDSISCASETFCVAADDDGQVMIYSVEPAPEIVKPPTITGTPEQGQTLTEIHGTWSNNPTEYEVQWERCNSSGSNCTAISGETAQNYGLTAADVGDTIRVTETAKNTTGSGIPASSVPTAVVQAKPVLKEEPKQKEEPVEGGGGGAGRGGGGGGNTPPTSFTATATTSVTVPVTATVSCPNGSASPTATATASASASGDGSATSTVSQQDAQNEANAAAKARAETYAYAAAKAKAEAKASGECKSTSITAATAFVLPSAKQCVSRRKFTIHVRKLPGITWVSAVITINGRRVKTVKRSQITALISLVGLPKGSFTLSITAKASNGRTVTGTRTYHTCVPGRGHHYAPPKL